MQSVNSSKDERSFTNFLGLTLLSSLPHKQTSTKKPIGSLHNFTKTEQNSLP